MFAAFFLFLFVLVAKALKAFAVELDAFLPNAPHPAALALLGHAHKGQLKSEAYKLNQKVRDSNG